MRAWLRTAATSDGRLLAREVRAWFDTGAYADNGPRVVATGADAAPGPYRWEAVQVDAWGVYTNTSPAGSYRAFGASHLQWCGELQVDEIARRCGLDALQIRAKSPPPREFVRPGGKPLDADLIGDIRKVAAGLAWETPKPAGIVGRGMSVGLLAAGAHPVSTAIVRGGGRWSQLARQFDRGGPGRELYSRRLSPRSWPCPSRWCECSVEIPALPLTTTPLAPAARRRSPVSACCAAADDPITASGHRVASLRSSAEALTVRAGAVWHEGESNPTPT